jgi:hypothetical protein
LFSLIQQPRDLYQGGTISYPLFLRQYISYPGSPFQTTELNHGDYMLKKILPILLALGVSLAACAPQAAPTMAAADIQGTAVSAAWTMVAATQAAIPTNTLAPPTEVPSPTSLPTFTPEPLLLIPTLPPLALAPPTMAAAPSDPNNCLKSLNLNEAGPIKNLNIQNQTKSTVNVSLNLYKPNSFGQCGSLSYVLGKGASKTVQVSSGSWYAFAWVLDPPSQVGYNFVVSTSKASGLRLIIREDKVIWYGQ